MKRFLFIFLVVFISIIGIYGTLQLQKAQIIAKSKQDLESFLNYQTGIYSYDVTKKDFSSKDSNTNLNYYLINSVDGIYFQSEEKIPIKIEKVGDTTNINIGKGIYIFVLNDIFEKYKINGDSFSINQLGKGIFFVSNLESDYKIYSFNSITNISLLNSGKEVVNFDLFPSLLFRYSPKNNDGLTGGDIIRISTVDSIFFVDSKSPDFEKNLNITNSKYTVGDFIEKSLLDIKNRYALNQNIYKEVLDLKVEEISGLSYINEYNSLLNNDTKKDVYYKNQILIYFLNILKNDNNIIALKENETNLSNALNDIKDYSDSAYKDGVDLLKSYYYLAYYSNDLNDNTSFSGTISKNNINKTIKDIFKENIAGKEYFSELSEAFFAYNFTGFSKAKMDEYLNNYLSELKSNNILKEKDFLNFSFFLTQYSLANNNISKNSLGIIIQLIDIFNSYYSTLKDNDKKSSALTMQFFNFTKIIGNLVNNILSMYFEKRSGNIVLKQEYTTVTGDQSDPNIDGDIIDIFGALYKNGISDLNSKKDAFYILAGKNITPINDNYLLLEDKYKKLGFIYNNILTDYNAYISKFQLSQAERNADSEKLDNNLILSLDDLTEYMHKFNSVDFGTLKILNSATMNTDRYYDVEVYMFNKRFRFKLFPDPKNEHRISNIEYVDNTGNLIKDDVNDIPLDKKEQDFQDKGVAQIDPKNQEKYDFKNFFYNSFLSDNTDDQSNIQKPVADTGVDDNESGDISIFKQNKLLNGDFTYVQDFIKIPFNSIKVDIQDGKYNISINKVYKTFITESSHSNVEMEMSYSFNEHVFQNISLRIVMDDPTLGYEIDGKYINIIPSTISHKEFSKKLANLGYFLQTIRNNYISSANSLKIDLNLSKVFIDSKSFDVKITN